MRDGTGCGEGCAERCEDIGWRKEGAEIHEWFNISLEKEKIELVWEGKKSEVRKRSRNGLEKH